MAGVCAGGSAVSASQIRCICHTAACGRAHAAPVRHHSLRHATYDLDEDVGVEEVHLVLQLLPSQQLAQAPHGRAVGLTLTLTLRTAAAGRTADAAAVRQRLGRRAAGMPSRCTGAALQLAVGRGGVLPGGQDVDSCRQRLDCRRQLGQLCIWRSGRLLAAPARR